jgi:phosphoglycolate phosphatase-like HAD superfamily hydrolase
MPGFPELLRALADAGARLGLATGNFSRAAEIKLEHYGIAEFFDGGGFGEISLERADVVRDAIHRVANGTPPQDTLVIGDTPHDITSALDNGVIGVGVATGNYSAEDLRASGAHAVFDDFADWEAAANALLRLTA